MFRLAVAAVSFGWTVILSVMRGAMEHVHTVDHVAHVCAASTSHAIESVVRGAMEHVQVHASDHPAEHARVDYSASTAPLGQIIRGQAGVAQNE